jgi:hypothetical protein
MEKLSWVLSASLVVAVVVVEELVAVEVEVVAVDAAVPAQTYTPPC